MWAALDDFRRNSTADGGLSWEDMLAVTLRECALGGLSARALAVVGSLFFVHAEGDAWDEPASFAFKAGEATVDFRHVNPRSDGDAIETLRLTPPTAYLDLDTWQRGENVDAYADGKLVVEGTWLESRTDLLTAEFTALQVKNPSGTYRQMVQAKLDDFMRWGRQVVQTDIAQTVGQAPRQRVISAMTALMGTPFSAIDLPTRSLPQVQDEAVIQRVFKEELGLTVDINVDTWPAGIQVR